MTERTARLRRNTDDNSTLSNSSSVLTRTTIREANNHLQMLYSRNQELEQLLHQQNQELHQKDVEYQKLLKTNQSLEQHCQQLQALLDDRTRRLNIYERKESLFRETIELKPAIESLLEILNTFEKVDNATSISSVLMKSKPLQFIPSNNKNINNDINH